MRASVKQCCFIFLSFMCLFFLPISSASAQEKQNFSIALSQTEPRAGDRIELVLSYSGEQQDVSAFLVQLEFDSNVFSYVRTETGSSLQSQYTKTETAENLISSVYTQKNQTELSLPKGELFRYIFTVNTSVSAENSPFEVSVLQAVDSTGSSVMEDVTLASSVTILEPLSTDCRLLSLEPSAGTLTPSFDAEVLQYQINVPFDVTQMTFEAKTAIGASWKVNRKNLGAGGSSTNFTLLVVSEDKTQTKSYVVTVNRGQKVSAATTSSAAKNIASAKKTATSSKTKKGIVSGANLEDTENEDSVNTQNSVQANGTLAEQMENLTQNSSNSPTLVLSGSDFTPFLWGALGSLLLALLAYLISLRLKLMILSKEEKIKRRNDIPPPSLRHASPTEASDEK